MYRFFFRLAQVYWTLFPRLSLGTRVLAIKEGQVLLVRMTYLENWYLPGGGVDRHESLPQGAARELLEETGYRAKDLKLVSMFFDCRKRASNHIALFVATDVEQVTEIGANAEIAEVGWFSLEALPAGVSPATQRRLDEYRFHRPPAEIW